MTITTTWEVNTLKRELADGYVCGVIYRVNGTDGTYNFRATGEIQLDRPETLIPYMDLTEETVIGWVKAKIDASEGTSVAEIEKAIEDNITAQKTPVYGAGTPWVVSE